MGFIGVGAFTPHCTREQFPLLDVEKTLEIADKLMVAHPTDRKSGIPYVLTTDFFITINDGVKEYDIARTVKPAKDLEKPRVLEKFEIERRYWLDKGVDWAIVAEHEMPREMVANIEWLYPTYRLEPTELLSIRDLRHIAELLKKTVC